MGDCAFNAVSRSIVDIWLASRSEKGSPRNSLLFRIAAVAGSKVKVEPPLIKLEVS